MNENATTIYKNVLTSNGPLPLSIDRDEWLRASRQTGKRHPLDPLGRCLSCGDQKLGYWAFEHLDLDALYKAWAKQHAADTPEP